MAEVIVGSVLAAKATVVLNESDMLALASIADFGIESIVDCLIKNITSEILPHKRAMVGLLQTLTSVSRRGIRDIDEAREFLRNKGIK